MMTDAPMIPAPTAESLSAYPVSIPWALCSHLRLSAVPEAVPWARRHATLKLAQWRLHGHLDAVQLVVTELTTNALRASAELPGSYLRLWLCADQSTVLIQVWDAADSMPARQDVHPDADHGRGLMIVDALSKDWGAYRLAAQPGKVVFALITV